MTNNRQSTSEEAISSTGRQYHIDLAPGELAEYILLSVDMVRAKRIASNFDQVTFERAHREFMTFTGTYHGHRVSVIGTGIGQDNTEMVFIESIQLFSDLKPTYIRVGSSGGLSHGVDVGDLIITSGAVRLESTSTYFVDEGYPAVAHHEVILALVPAADHLHDPYHVGLTASAAGFYGAEGRVVAGIKSKDPEIYKRLAEWNVLNMEMESSTLLTLSSLAGVRAGCVCALYNNRSRDEWISDEIRTKADLAAEKVALESVRLLAKMDAWKAKHQKPYYMPDIKG